MSAEERENLSLGLARGHSVRAMVAASARHREPRACPQRDARPYRACTAQTLATAQARQPRRLRNLLDPWPGP